MQSRLSSLAERLFRPLSSNQIKVYPAAAKALDELITDPKWAGVKVCFNPARTPPGCVRRMEEMTDREG